jgi:radical SAM superfamily enzyme YgiQ (UPF0313 family)
MGSKSGRYTTAAKESLQEMKYEGIIIRPPSEAGSLLLQVSVGCSHNRCTFCPTYKNERFRIKTFPEIEEDILEAGKRLKVKRIFLCDGDALIIPQPRLVAIISFIREIIPGVERIACYANAMSILRKSSADLEALRHLGLKMIYLGVESGDETVLNQVVKGVNVQQMIQAGRRVKEAGLILSVTVILGIGGVERSIEHALHSAQILTDIDPDYVGALTLMLVPGTPLHNDYRRGLFVLPNAFGFLRELFLIICNASFTNCFFSANHASNYLPLRAHLPMEKGNALQMIDHVLAQGNSGMLRPEFLRAL